MSSLVSVPHAKVHSGSLDDRNGEQRDDMTFIPEKVTLQNCKQKLVDKEVWVGINEDEVSKDKQSLDQCANITNTVANFLLFPGDQWYCQFFMSHLVFCDPFSFLLIPYKKNSEANELACQQKPESSATTPRLSERGANSSICCCSEFSSFSKAGRERNDLCQDCRNVVMKPNILNTQNAKKELIIGSHCGWQGWPASLACADKLFMFVHGHPLTQPPDGPNGTNCGKRNHHFISLRREQTVYVSITDVLQHLEDVRG
ncbi:hypothetical protein EK904_010668 [Melospiza melodia maxima]|nr:hypothetical protein EK904_010668 [Melospiza melodia maxima]